MMLGVFSVYDQKVAAFLQPFYARTKGEAIRSFSEAANDQNHQFSKHSADYSLFYLGDWDDNTGVFNNSSQPQQILSASEVAARSIN